MASMVFSLKMTEKIRNRSNFLSSRSENYGKRENNMTKKSMSVITVPEREEVKPCHGKILIKLYPIEDIPLGIKIKRWPKLPPNGTISYL
jgi:hypothetical protein